MEPAALVLVDCQPSTLKWAMTNLIDNAVKYGRQAHRALQANAATVQIAIDDAGPGISEADPVRVLQPFCRVEGSRSRDSGGVGLGLAIAQSLLQRNRATMSLHNRPSGGLRGLVVTAKAA